MKRLIGILILLLGAPMAGHFAWAQGFPSSLLLAPMPMSPLLRISRVCRRAHVPVFMMEKRLLGFAPDGTYHPRSELELTTGRTADVDHVADSILQDWQTVHQYAAADKIEMLRGRDRSLSALRSSYFLYQSPGGHKVGLRIFDASTRVLRYNEEWPEASRTDVRSPLEISDPDYQLPERKIRKETGEDIYFWELGLLTVDPAVKEGIATAFHHAAELLDNHYNGAEFRFFANTRLVKEMKMMIYAQTRESQVDIFRKYGLEPVLDANRQPVRLASGLILIACPATRFLEINLTLQLFASEKESGPYYDKPALKNWITQRQKELKWLDSQKQTDLIDNHSLYFYWELIQNEMNRTRRLPNGSVEKEEAAMFFLSTYYRFVNSIPPNLRVEGWDRLRRTILTAMTAPKFVSAYLQLHYIIESAARADLDPISVEERARWRQNLPAIPLLKPFRDFPQKPGAR